MRHSRGTDPISPAEQRRIAGLQREADAGVTALRSASQEQAAREKAAVSRAIAAAASEEPNFGDMTLADAKSAVRTMLDLLDGDDAHASRLIRSAQARAAQHGGVDHDFGYGLMRLALADLTGNPDYR